MGYFPCTVQTLACCSDAALQTGEENSSHVGSNSPQHTAGLLDFPSKGHRSLLKLDNGVGTGFWCFYLLSIHLNFWK